MIRIRQLRHEHGLSQRELADKIGVSQKAIDLWEKELTEPKASAVIGLADIFGCTADYLLGREDEFGNVNVMCELSGGERQALDAYARLDKQQRNEWLNFAAFLAQKNEKI